jgi:hypothetical protein
MSLFRQKYIGDIMSDQQLDQGQATTTQAVGGDSSQPPAQPELTIQDLGNLRSIIDVASQRGAFRAAEMAAVGTAFNKLNDFLNAVAPQQPATPNADASTQATA